MTTDLKTPDAPARRAEVGTHVHAVRPTKIADFPPARRRRTARRWRTISALLLIAIPMVAASVYYGLFASDQYVSEIRFSVRGKETPSTDAIGMLAGFPVTQSVSDSYVVADYIKSRELLDELSRSINLRALYSRQDVDWWARFDATQPIEELVDYWRWMANVKFDSTSSIITVGIRAFTPEDAQLIAEKILSASTALVNRLSAEARRDAVRNAEVDASAAATRSSTRRAAPPAGRNSTRSCRPISFICDPNLPRPAGSSTPTRRPRSSSTRRSRRSKASWRGYGPNAHRPARRARCRKC